MSSVLALAASHPSGSNLKGKKPKVPFARGDSRYERWNKRARTLGDEGVTTCANEIAEVRAHGSHRSKKQRRKEE